MLAWVVVFVVPLVSGAGQSLGQRTVWLAVVPERQGADGGTRLTRWARVRRGLGGGALWGLLQALSDAATMFDVGALAPASGLAAVLGAVLVLAVPFTVGKRGLSGTVASYQLTDARSPTWTVVGSVSPP